MELREYNKLVQGEITLVSDYKAIKLPIHEVAEKGEIYKIFRVFIKHSGKYEYLSFDLQCLNKDKFVELPITSFEVSEGTFWKEVSEDKTKWELPFVVSDVALIPFEKGFRGHRKIYTFDIL